MVITARLFEANLKCPTKFFLWSRGESATGNVYADWVQTQKGASRSESIKRLLAESAPGECIIGPSSTETLKTAQWRLAVDFVARAENLESHIHVVQRVPPGERGEPAQFIPMPFVFTNKLTTHDKLLLGFDALVLSETLGREISLGKIIHGDDHARRKVRRLGYPEKTGHLKTGVSKISREMGAGMRGKRQRQRDGNRRNISVGADLRLRVGFSSKTAQKESVTNRKKAPDTFPELTR